MPRITREELQSMWDLNPPVDREGAERFLRLAGELVPPEEKRFLRGKMVQLRTLRWGASRGTAYESEKVKILGHVLFALGLVSFHSEWRDLGTGERCKCRLMELARLDRGNWNAPANRAWLKEQWPRLAQLPLAKLKAEIRSQNERAHCKHSVKFFAKQIRRVLESAADELAPGEYDRLLSELAAAPAKSTSGRIITFPDRVGDLSRGEVHSVSKADCRR